MDVRCEKCQTEYELDEARLKPGGVTVKCTNCGHQFKIRKRPSTHVGTPPAVSDTSTQSSSRQRANSSRTSMPVITSAGSGPAPSSTRSQRQDSIFDEEAQRAADDAPTTVERQWLLRLENGEQKSCRELATLQQWIIASVVTRETLISRTGKTWKRLGDVVDLSQYFEIADEARANRERIANERRDARPSQRPAASPAPTKDIPGTLPGYTPAQAAGGTILPDDDDDASTQHIPKIRRGGTPPPPVPAPMRGAARTPPMGLAGPAATAPTMPTVSTTAPTAPISKLPSGAMPGPNAAYAATQPAPVLTGGAPLPARQPATTPPPTPPVRLAGKPTPTPPPPVVPQGNRSTGMWAKDGMTPEQPAEDGDGAAGPMTGKIAALPDEPAFAGRVRMTPSEASFDTNKVRALDDDDMLPTRRGSRTGMLVLIMALAVMAAAAAVVYFVVFRTPGEPVALPAVKDAGVIDAAAAIVAVSDTNELAATPLDSARGDLAADLEARLRMVAQELDGKTDAASQAVRAHVIAQLAQGLGDRAALVADKAEAETLRRESRQLVLDAATAAQRALSAAADDAGANVAMAAVLRLQAKPAKDIARYLDTARAKADAGWTRELALADALMLARDGKLDEARTALAALDQGDGALETSGDVRARLHLALVLAQQGKPDEARPLVEAILAAQPAHTTARALASKLETVVTKTDPLPPEDPAKEPAKDPAGDPKPTAGTLPAPNKPATVPSPPAAPVPPKPALPPTTGAGAAEPYDRVLARANQLAESNCARAMELYAKALEQKPNGVEALSGMGYCHIDAKQFASAFSKFRAALAVSPRYEAALRGIAEAYQQQGRKEQAIEAYRAYLDAYPDSAAARRQLDRLGGDAAPPPSAPSAPAAPAPPSEPAPSDGSGSN